MLNRGGETRVRALFLSAIGLAALGGLSPPAGARAPSCPGTLAEWRQWQKAGVDAIAANRFDSADTASAKVYGKLQPCQAALRADPQAQACVANLASFARAQWQSSRPGHTMALEVTDELYYRSVPYSGLLELPDELKDPGFLKLLDQDGAAGPAGQPEGWEAALKRIAEVNESIAEPSLKWRAFIYRSQHLATPDATGALGRFFVFVPGPKFDRFIQFGLRESPADPLAMSFSFVGVQKTDPESGAELGTKAAYLQDVWRLRTPGGIRLATRLSQTHQLENCYECHKNAVLPITPEAGSFDLKRFGPSVDFVNSVMKGYGALKYAGLDMAAYGPGLGPLQWARRSDGFVRACFGGRAPDEASVSRVRQAMTCTACHNGATRGLLNFPSGLRKLPDPFNDTLVDAYVVRHPMMPQGSSLSAPEREALVRCLDSEYYDGTDEDPGVLKSWLLQNECWQPLLFGSREGQHRSSRAPAKSAR